MRITKQAPGIMGAQHKQSSRSGASAGHRYYTPFFLRYVYDTCVLGGNGRFLWGCPPSELVAHFKAHASQNHLDIGVGTGYIIDKADMFDDRARLVLMDANPHTLAHCAERLRRFQPALIEHDALIEPPAALTPFTSISMNNLLHCLPGTLPEKAPALQLQASKLAPGGTFFGTTILTRGVDVPFYSRPMLHVLNRSGGMSNLGDSLGDLERLLAQNFDAWKLRVVGMMALFSATRG
ncbi:MAG: class I SAM-dependent methyltransferase [Pseudomonadota bacterium]